MDRLFIKYRPSQRTYPVQVAYSLLPSLEYLFCEWKLYHLRLRTASVPEVLRI